MWSSKSKSAKLSSKKTEAPKRAIYWKIFETTILAEDLITLIVEYVISFEGDFVKTIGKQGHGSLEFNIFCGLATDNEYIYVCDSENNRIQQIDKEGRYISCFGSFGTNSSELHWPGYLAIYDSLLYVSDQGNRRIQIFSLPNCTHHKTFSCKYEPWGICIQKSIIYVSFSDSPEIHKFTLDGELIEYFKHKEFLHYGNIYNHYMAIYDDTLFLIFRGIFRDIFDGNLDRIGCLSINGETKDFIPYKFNKLGCLTFHNNMLYVIDAEYFYKFDRAYNLVEKWIFKGNASCILFFEDLCFVSEWKEKYIIVYK